MKSNLGIINLMKRMKTFKYALLATVLAVGATACRERVIDLYAIEPAINFVLMDNNGVIVYDPSLLYNEHNFGTSLPIPDSTNIDTLRIVVRLQGKPHPTPLNISLSVVKDGDGPMAGVRPMNPYILGAGEYEMILGVPVDRPDGDMLSGTEYKARLVFDYANSDVIRGAEELQEFSIAVTNNLTMDMLGLTMDDWEWGYEGVIGPFSFTKARVMIMVSKSTNIMNYYGYYGPSGTRLQALKDALEKYNTEISPGNPLRDENGNLVAFEPAE